MEWLTEMEARQALSEVYGRVMSSAELYRFVRRKQISAPTAHNWYKKADIDALRVKYRQFQSKLTIAEVMGILGKSRLTVFAMIKDGRLPALKSPFAPYGYVFSQDDIDDYIESANQWLMLGDVISMAQDRFGYRLTRQTWKAWVKKYNVTCQVRHARLKLYYYDDVVRVLEEREIHHRQ